MESMMIEMEDLVKKFPHTNAEKQKGWKTAVAGISLSVRHGEVFGLLGPNGAGKTTIIRMLTMQTQATSGVIRIGGQDIRRDPRTVKEMIGVVPQNLNFDQDLSVGENLELHARLYHMKRGERAARIAELLEYMELTGVYNDSVRQLSGGMKRRLLIARALIHRPRILFLDEPTVALDPQVRRRIWDYIRGLAKMGATILLTTHYIEEAEALCDRVAIMNGGRLLALDTPPNLLARLGKYVVEWEEGAHREFRLFDTREAGRQFIGTMEGAASLRRSNLEDVFIELTGRKEGI